MTFDEWLSEQPEIKHLDATGHWAYALARKAWDAALTNTLPKMGIPEWPPQSDRPDGGAPGESQQDYFGG